MANSSPMEPFSCVRLRLLKLPVVSTFVVVVALVPPK